MSSSEYVSEESVWGVICCGGICGVELMCCGGFCGVELICFGWVCGV